MENVGFVRGRWYKKWINCPEDKRDYDYLMQGFMKFREDLPHAYVNTYKPASLTKDEIAAIVTYRGQYGLKIDDFSWWQMYYDATGIHNPRFVPDTIAGLVLYPYYNDSAYELTWRDKNMFSRLLPDVPMPQTYAKCIRNRYLIDGTYFKKESNKSEVCEHLYHTIPINSSVIVKGTRESGFGRGVRKYVINNYEDIYGLLEEWNEVQNFIIQECIEQHDVLSNLNPECNNMIRICSWRHGNEVDILYAAARVGIGKSTTDVVFVNGEERVNVVGITQDGFLKKQVVNQNGQLVSVNDSVVKIPAWDEIVKIIKKNHLLLDNFDIVGWDFTIDKNGKPICFEWNIQWPGTVLYQYVNGPLYGDYTENIFSFLKDENNRYNYIPSYMRIIKK